MQADHPLQALELVVLELAVQDVRAATDDQVRAGGGRRGDQRGRPKDVRRRGGGGRRGGNGGGGEV